MWSDQFDQSYRPARLINDERRQTVSRLFNSLFGRVMLALVAGVAIGAFFLMPANRFVPSETAF